MQSRIVLSPGILSRNRSLRSALSLSPLSSCQHPVTSNMNSSHIDPHNNHPHRCIAIETAPRRSSYLPMPIKNNDVNSSNVNSSNVNSSNISSSNRLLSTSTSSISTVIAADQTDSFNIHSASNGNGNGNININQKNMEVVNLVQSLQNIVDKQQTLGLYYAKADVNANVNADNNSDANANASIPIKNNTSTSKNTNTKPTKGESSSSSSSSTSKNQQKKIKESYTKTKKWHYDFNESITKGDEQNAIALFKQMPPLHSFHYITHEEKSKDAMNKMSFLFNTLRKFVNLLATSNSSSNSSSNSVSSIMPRIDIAFAAFLKSEQLHFSLEQQIQQQLDDANDNDDDDDDAATSTALNDRCHKMNQKLQQLRALMLVRMTISMGYAKEIKYSTRGNANANANTNTNTNTNTNANVNVNTITNKTPFSRNKYTKMISELITIIQYDIHDDPFLQQILYTKLMKSLMRQTYCKMVHFRYMEKGLWDLALSSFDDLLEKHGEIDFDSDRESHGVGGDDGMDMNMNMDMNMYENDHYDHATEYEEIDNVQDYENRNDHQKRNQLIQILNEYEHLLNFSTFRKQADLPFVKLLEMVVANGCTPKSEVAMNVVQNEYPYTDNNNNRSLINSIVILQQKKHPLQSDYLISPLTLEQITLSTAKRGISDIIMSVWEYMKLVDTSIQNQNQEQQSQGEDNDASSSSSLYSRPTEGLYENAALSFASTGKHDELAFGILAEMEGQGHEPSRSFLSRLASTMRIRSSVRRLDRSVFIIRSNHEHAMNNYHHGQEGENDDEITMKPTKSTLNTLIAAYADLGFSTKAMEIYDDFERLECTPDENTYSYLMDSIVMNVTTTLPFNLRGKIVGQKVNNDNADMNDNASTNANGNQYDDDQFDAESWLDAQIEAADAIYEAANEMGHGCDGNLIHAYVQILCSIGKLEKAKSLLDEKVDNQEWIPEETFGLLALSNAHIGNMEAVDDVVQMCRQTGYKGGLPIHVAKRIQVLRKSM